MVIQWGVPEPEQIPTRLGTQRRQLSYTLARWRNRFNRIRRAISQIFTRIRPSQTRMDRLRKRLDEEVII
jgi:hypothetical protein